MDVAELDSLIEAERAALVAELSQLTDDQWEQTSLCTEWNIHEVLAHLGAGLTIGGPGWMFSILRAGFRPAVHNRRQIARFVKSKPAETLDRFAALGTENGEPIRLPTKDRPPWLGELVVHGQDIRQPLGIEREPDLQALLPVAEFYASRDFAVHSKSQVKGLHLRATDAEFTTNDPGLPAVEGPLLALVMVMAGRPAYLDGLNGPGMSELSHRLKT